jgi:hypothetical protein
MTWSELANALGVSLPRLLRIAKGKELIELLSL